MLSATGRRVVLVVVIAIGVCIVVVAGIDIFFYANGGMWPGTHSNPPHTVS